ncbi:MAG: protein kinase domain-containing protein [Planctomycetota bacterium]|jgi:serine/threonine-protein kinase
MKFTSTDDLARKLVKLRLVTRQELADCQRQHEVTSDPKSLVDGLEAQHVLTNYQASKIKSGEDAPLVLGSYKLLYQNASGSFARVFRGCSIDTGDMIGIKVLRQRYLDDPKSVAHFHREAELCMKLRHRNIVPIYDVGQDNDWHYFTMEFVEGGNLRQLITIRQKLEIPELLRAACDMAEGLEYALTQGMTHRDFKMTNVLMSSRGVAKLVDFGLAGDDSDSDDENVQAVEYATIEKHTGAPANDPRSDLFFLGAVLYELASGVPPYPSSRNREERKQFSRYSGIRPLRQSNPSISTRVADIIDRLLRINPHERYQSATELLKDLRPALAELGTDEDKSRVNTKQAPRMSTVLCVEYRVKQQDLLREYLTKHGFRVLMLSAWDRALTRIRNNPPDAVVVMGDALEGNASEAYDEAIRWCHTKSVGCVLVLPANDQATKDSLQLSPSARALQQPVKLRDLRNSLLESLQSVKNRE